MLDFQYLYDTYATDVYRFAYWLCGDPVDAEDISSETFLRAWTRRASIRTETMKAYLLSIARNLYLERLRKHRLHTELSDGIPDPVPGPEVRSEDRDDLLHIRKALQKLTEVDRAAFILRVEQELPYEEIARILQISLSAVKVKVHRVRLKLTGVVANEEAYS